ncbi:hypothetical protein [Halomonas alkaliantarctica]|uniref:hypothetical protein n=1 Tax=Halomonas alkaliantarctica TaxID=232346 RepID=UPI0004AA289C|nr:hypothetical protein [Halomonas alkaliantarctica]
MVSEKGLNEVLEWSISSIVPGGVFFITEENERVSLKKCLEVILNNSEQLKENDGYEEWEWFKDRFKDKVEINVANNLENKSSDWAEVLDLCLVFIFEIFYITGYKELKEDLDKLLSAREVYLKKMENKKQIDSFDKYASGIRKGLDLYRKAQASESMINKEISKRLKEYKDKEEDLNYHLDELKKNVSALKGDASFLSSSKVFNKLEESARVRERRAFQAVFIFAIITVLYLFSVAVYLGANQGLPFSLSIDEGFNSLMFWEEIRLIDVKLFMISSTFIFLGIYFFRVFLSIYQGNVKRLQELELKSAISVYIEGHVKFVKEYGKDCGASIAKYEDFIFSSNEFSENEIQNPKPTDSLKGVGEVAEKLVKAGIGKK